MTVSTSFSVIDSACNGVTTAFPVAFQFANPSDLIVELIDDMSLTISLLVEGTDYTRSGDGMAAPSGINTAAAYPAGKTIRRRRQTPQTQALDMVPNVGAPAESQERAWDRAILIGQEISEIAGRALKVPVGEAVGLLPAAAARAGRALAFDPAGAPIAIPASAVQLTADLAALAASVAVVEAEINNPPLAAARVFAQTSGHRIFVEGDSKSVLCGGYLANSALNWALAKYPVDVFYDPIAPVGSTVGDNLGVNGSTSGTSATAGTDYYGNTPIPLGIMHATRLARTRAAILRGCDTAILEIGVNDVLGADTGAGSTVANIMAWHAIKRTEGLKHLILFTIGPVGSGTPTALQAKYTLARNRALHQYAALNADVSIVDPNGWMLDTSSALFIPKGGTTNVVGTTTYDGLHENVYGGYGMGMALGAVLARLFPPRDPSLLHASDTYDAADGNRANLFGSIGRFGGSGGFVSFPGSTVTNAGVAAAGWVFAAGAGLTGLTIDFSVVPCSYLNNKYGRTDFNALRMSLTGTPGGTGFGAMAIYNLTPVDISAFAPAGVKFDSMFTMTCNALVGATCFQRYMQPNAFGSYAYWGNQQTSPSDVLPQLDGDFHFGMPAPWNLPDTSKVSLLSGVNIGYRAGVAMSGSIDFVGATLTRSITLP